MPQSHGWSLDGMTIRELVPSEDSLRPDDQYTMFHPSEIELSETTKTILADVERIKPARVVFDSLSELRLLAGNPLRYRRQILALKQFFAGRSCTVLLLDDMTSTQHDLQVQSIAHGVVRLEQLYPEYGAERRRLIVLKMRGVRFRGGYHDYMIERGGLEVYPRLVASEHRPDIAMEKMASGIAEFDALARRRHRARHQHARSSALRAPANRRSPRNSRPPRPRAGKRRRCSSSTKAATRCSRALPDWAST